MVDKSGSKTVFSQAEFSLTCQIRNVTRPKVLWFKDSTYQINASIAQSIDRITMDIRSDLIRDRDFLAILFIRDANEMDAGQFTCKVSREIICEDFFFSEAIFLPFHCFNENQYSIRERRLKR